MPRVGRLLERRGAGEDHGASGSDSWVEESPVLAGLAAASVQGRFALVVRAGRSVRRCGGTYEPGEWQQSSTDGHARQEGFDLHAAVRVPAGARACLDASCRDALRPPVAQDRLTLTTAGQVVLRLRPPRSDGTTHKLFDPVEFLERLAVLVPRPRINLVLYHGVLAPRAGWRPLVVRVGDVEPSEAAQASDGALAAG